MWPIYGMGNKSRRYISDQYGSERLILVFNKEEDTIKSEGPYTNLEEAQATMKNFLLKGICSWMVTYNEQ